MTVDEMLNEADFPKAELAYKYAPGESLVRPKQVNHLPTQLRRLHDWYMEVIKEGRTMLMVKVTKEHYIRDNDMCIMHEELFQLYNQDVLDKSIVSCYCL